MSLKPKEDLMRAQVLRGRTSSASGMENWVPAQSPTGMAPAAMIRSSGTKTQ